MRSRVRLESKQVEVIKTKLRQRWSLWAAASLLAGEGPVPFPAPGGPLGAHQERPVVAGEGGPRVMPPPGARSHGVPVATVLRLVSSPPASSPRLYVCIVRRRLAEGILPLTSHAPRTPVPCSDVSGGFRAENQQREAPGKREKEMSLCIRERGGRKCHFVSMPLFVYICLFCSHRGSVS